MEALRIKPQMGGSQPCFPPERLQEVVIKDQTKDEMFTLKERRDNGYATLYMFKLDKDGKVTKKTPEEIIVPVEDILGEQKIIRFE